MLLSGSWLLFPGLGLVPVVRLDVAQRDGTWQFVPFLIDSGAETTVVTPLVFRTMQFLSQPTQAHVAGVAGAVPALNVETRLRVRVGEEERFVFQIAVRMIQSEDAVDVCLLGRDVLNHFSLIIDRPQESVLLLRGPHRYRVESE